MLLLAQNSMSLQTQHFLLFVLEVTFVITEADLGGGGGGGARREGHMPPLSEFKTFVLLAFYPCPRPSNPLPLDLYTNISV